MIFGTYNQSKNKAEELQTVIKNLKLFQVDLSKRQDTIKFLKKIKKDKFKAIINNAGIFVSENFDKYDFAVWDQMLELNLTAPLLITNKLRNNILKGGAIINISSIWGVKYGGTTGIAYSASKSALHTLTKTFANIFGPKDIRAVAIAPGFIDTDMAQANGEKALDYYAKNTPLGRIGKPEEIADLLEILISDKASFINGEVIVIDGGYTVND